MAGLQNLVVWREAASLADEITLAAEECRGIARVSAAAQLVRAADSISANIAEGHGRGVNRDGLRFFRIAKGSVDELENHLLRARQSRRLRADVVDRLISHAIRVRFLILRYMAWLERRISELE